MSRPLALPVEYGRFEYGGLPVHLQHQFGVGDQEDEADWLSGEMLIPCDGAFRPARANVTDQQAAGVSNVSLAVARWRMNPQWRAEDRRTRPQQVGHATHTASNPTVVRLNDLSHMRFGRRHAAATRRGKDYPSCSDSTAKE
jgi:hypothetical protein